jgi:hypothetical protein
LVRHPMYTANVIMLHSARTRVLLGSGFCRARCGCVGTSYPRRRKIAHNELTGYRDTPSGTGWCRTGGGDATAAAKSTPLCRRQPLRRR